MVQTRTGDLKVHIKYDVIYFGLVAEDQFPEEKAQRMLEEVKNVVSTMFYNDLSKVYEHKGLERNSLGKIKQMK